MMHVYLAKQMLQIVETALQVPVCPDTGVILFLTYVWKYVPLVSMNLMETVYIVKWVNLALILVQ